MFSNWFAPSPAAACGVAGPPPDIVIELGPPPFTRFAAHSDLVAAHSGYLRSAIPAAAAAIDAEPIYVPNISSEQFAPLLTYMYTGFLDLTVDNIFGILLATHILHMPTALEMCRAFLAQSQVGAQQPQQQQQQQQQPQPPQPPSPSGRVRVVRPIASKPPIVSAFGFVAHRPTPRLLLSSQDTSFRTCGARIDTQDEAPPDTGRAVQPELSGLVVSATASATVATTANVPPKSTATRKSGRLKAHGDEATARTALAIDTNLVETHTAQQPVQPDSDRIIVDVASCDGPVRFRRVLNDAYGRQPSADSGTEKCGRTAATVTTSFHQQMARAINATVRRALSEEESENSNSGGVGIGGGVGSRADNIGELFNCVYCKHTFKSQYCYQKHAKRHLNPLTDGDKKAAVDAIAATLPAAAAVAAATPTATTMRREVRPLDMNVQYYPCKTCGSKFPSYYFVHKHRKMCHADEEDVATAASTTTAMSTTTGKVDHQPPPPNVPALSSSSSSPPPRQPSQPPSSAD